MDNRPTLVPREFSAAIKALPYVEQMTVSRNDGIIEARIGVRIPDAQMLYMIVVTAPLVALDDPTAQEKILGTLREQICRILLGQVRGWKTVWERERDG